MATPTATDRLSELTATVSRDEYNYRHFRTKHLLRDVRRTVRAAGIAPGELAPDFELPAAGGGTLRLSELRGRPVLLHFGSRTWPVTAGSVEPLRELHARWGRMVRFVDVLIRQAHPGPGAPAYDIPEDKLRDAERYRREERIPWPVLADDVDGTVHQAYGGLADPTYLLDVDGRVAFYDLWTHVPTLHRAVEALVARDGRGVVLGGIDRVPHMLPALTDGWKGLRHGLPQSYVELELATPGAGTATFLGHQLRPLLAPLTLRSTPLPTAARLALGAGAAALLGLTAFTILRARTR